MTKNNIIQVFFLLILFSSCSKVPNGYIADIILYERNVLTVKPGVTYRSQIPDLNGSSQPVKFTLLTVKDASGKETDDLTKERDLNLWIAPFIPEVDTTLALVLAKRKKSKSPVLLFNERNGQITITEASAELVPGSEYFLDIQLNNSAGRKIYSDIVKIKIDPSAKPFELFRLQNNIVDASTNAFLKYTADPTINISYVPNSASGQTNKIKIMIFDKFNNPWNPKKGEIIPRGDRNNMLTYAFFSPPVFTDSAMIFEFPFSPFPYTDFHDNYYRIKNIYAQADGYKKGQFFVHPIWDIKYYKDGTYTVKIYIPDITRIP